MHLVLLKKLFTYHPNIYKNGEEATIEITIGEVKQKFITGRAESYYEDSNEQDNTITSFVNITESFYNKTGDDNAEVIIQ
ncbi:hypothetical protein ACFQ9Y_26290 [Peribacillus simplex]|uniref:hypothetical protein n=1 Tax=Peribacillus simplex TaxID=1478 RepID=UPI00366ABAB2